MRAVVLCLLVLGAGACQMPFVDACDLARRTAAKGGLAFAASFDQFSEKYQDHILATPPAETMPERIIEWAKIDREVRKGMRDVENALVALGEAVAAYRAGKQGDIATAMANATVALAKLAEIVKRHKIPIEPPKTSSRESRRPMLARGESGPRRPPSGGPAMAGGAT